MQSPEIKSFSSQRLTLSYADWGNEGAPVLCLVHGGRDQKRSWDWVARELASDFQVVAHDLRGHGESGWVTDGDYGVMDHVYDLHSLIKHLGADQVYLIGHSLGGNITVRFTGLFPEKVIKLVSMEGLGPSPRMIAERAAELLEDKLQNWVEQRDALSVRQARIIPDLEAAKKRMAEAHPQLTPEYVHHLTLHGLRKNDDGTVSWSYDPAGMGRSPTDITQEQAEHLWTRITCPTLLQYGADSWASNPEKDGRIKHFKNAQVAEYANAGHWLHHDQFDQVIADIKAFLKG